MTTLSQRIEHTQTELNDCRDRLAAINGAEMFDVDAAEENERRDRPISSGRFP